MRPERAVFIRGVNLRDERADGSFLRHVDDARRANASGGGAQAARLPQFVLDDIARPYARTASRERLSDRASKPVCCPGDDRGPASEIETHVHS